MVPHLKSIQCLKSLIFSNLLLPFWPGKLNLLIETLFGNPTPTDGKPHKATNRVFVSC